MKNILHKIDGWIFGTIGGKIIMMFLAVYGLAVAVAMAMRYDHALEMVKDAR